ncbi:MAG: hypothetical protein V5A34_05895 [Halapricum sp.]
MASKSPESDDKTGVPRRKFVAGGAAGWASVAIAGCTGGDGNGNGDTTEPTDTETEPETTEPTETETETPEPQPENYVVIDEMRTGSEFVPEGTGGFAAACAPSRTFSHGMQAVFYVGVYDPDTGDSIGPDSLDSVQISLDRGQTVELSWAEEEGEWHGNWIIPEDAEAGDVTYTVDVATDAETTYVSTLESSFSIIEYDAPGNYVVTDDTYAGSAGQEPYSENQFISGCAPSRQFAPGMMVGFDIGIYDGLTGEPVGPTDFEYEGVVSDIESVRLTVDGYERENEELAWLGGEGDHSEMGEDLYWNGVWYIPEDAEAGEVTYSVEIETEESTSWVGVHKGSITIVET